VNTKPIQSKERVVGRMPDVDLPISTVNCCELFKNIIIDERKGEESRYEIVDDNESTSRGSMFQKLEVISIEKCQGIQIIFAVSLCSGFSSTRIHHNKKL